MRSVATSRRYVFAATQAVNAGGMVVRIPPGDYPVERRSLVHRVRLGGREVDLTLAEFRRLQRAGLVRVSAGGSVATPEPDV